MFLELESESFKTKFAWPSEIRFGHPHVHCKTFAEKPGRRTPCPVAPRRSGRGIQSAQSLRRNILFTKADAVVSEPLIAPSHRPGSSASVGTAPSGNLHPFNPPRTAIVRCQQGHTRQRKAPIRLKKFTHNSRAADARFTKVRLA